jgi:hypothetical protein
MKQRSVQAGWTVNNWHVMTVTHGGTVSLIKNVSHATAHEIKERLLEYQTPPPGMSTWGYSIDSGTIVRVELLGPEEAE